MFSSITSIYASGLMGLGNSAQRVMNGAIETQQASYNEDTVSISTQAREMLKQNQPDIVHGMVEMKLGSSLFQANAKVIQTANEMTDTLLNLTKKA